MKSKKQIIKNRTQQSLRLPDGKSNFFSESNEMYPPVVQEKHKNQKEVQFVVDWQLPVNK